MQGAAAEGLQGPNKSDAGSGLSDGLAVGDLVSEEWHADQGDAKSKCLVHAVGTAVRKESVALGEKLDLRHSLTNDEVRRWSRQAFQHVGLTAHHQNNQEVLLLSQGFEGRTEDVLDNLLAGAVLQTVVERLCTELFIPEVGVRNGAQGDQNKALRRSESAFDDIPGKAAGRLWLSIAS